MFDSTHSSVAKDPSSTPDHELIESALGGDQGSYGLLLGKYQDRLFRSITSNVGCPTLAEDIVQEAFVRAFLNLHTFKRQCNFYTWLYRIALNARRPYFRHPTRALSSESDREKILADKRDSPATRAERSEECKQVQRALEKIEPHHRTILILREFDGLDYQAISEVLHINKGTVRSRLSRARARLRKELADYVGGARPSASAPAMESPDLRFACTE